MKTTQLCVVKFNSFEQGIPAKVIREGSKKTKVLLLGSSTIRHEGEVVRVWNRMIIFND